MGLDIATQPEWVLGVIDDHGQVIRDVDPNRQKPMKPNPERWRHHNEGDPDVEWALDTFPDGIRRSDIKQAAQDLSTAQRRRRVLVLVLMWGAGKTARHYGNHRRALTMTGLDDVLADAQERVGVGDLDGAWRRATAFHGNGMRYPFFTKWLWAAGTATAHPVVPLIFDSYVISNLRYLGWDWMKGSSNTRKRWVAYCRDAAAIAGELSVTSEHVEYWLFGGARST